MTSRLLVASVSRTAAPDLALYPGWLRWPLAVLRTARPRQWPKNLLVFAAPLAGASLGRDDGLGYALVAAVAFCAASVAVYMVNDVVDADRDRRHPVKCTRPVAAGILPKSHALAIAAGCAVAALAAGLAISVPLLSAILAGYLASSLLYCLVLKHLPVIELVFVASGFVLRALGGAAATHVPPSGWFLLVCSLGAFLVATAKRYTEMVVLGADAVRHRPSTRWYRPAALRLTQRMTAIAMIIAYLLWAGRARCLDQGLAPGQRRAARRDARALRLPHRASLPPTSGGSSRPGRRDGCAGIRVAAHVRGRSVGAHSVGLTYGRLAEWREVRELLDPRRVFSSDPGRRLGLC